MGGEREFLWVWNEILMNIQGVGRMTGWIWYSLDRRRHDLNMRDVIHSRSTLSILVSLNICAL